VGYQRTGKWGLGRRAEGGQQGRIPERRLKITIEKGALSPEKREIKKVVLG